MKKIFIYSTACLILFLSACKPTREEALKYNDAIIDEQVAVMDLINALNSSINTYDKDTFDLGYKKLDAQLNKSIQKVSSMDDLGGKTEFKDAAIAYFKTIKEGMVSELKPALNQYGKPLEEATEEDDEKADVLYHKFIDRLKKAFKPFVDAQNKQAKEYDYEIEKSH